MEIFDLPLQTMVEEVRKALDYGELDEVVSTGFKLKITRKDISTLCNYSWLNDEVQGPFTHGCIVFNIFSH